MRVTLLLALAATLTLTPTAYAQTAAVSPAWADRAEDVRESREVLAEGRAAIGPKETGGALAARQAAIADALRNALEKTVGVYVAAQSLTHNYQLVRDDILTHADGFVTLKQVVRTETGIDTVRVVVRAVVSTRPLAERLKALKLTRGFRVFVSTTGADDLSEPVATALTDAGFFVTEEKGDADLVVRVVPRYTTVASTPLRTAAGPMTMRSVRAEVTLKAVRAETGETVATLTDADTAAHIAAPTARAEAATGALQNLAPRLADALLILPAAATQPVEVVVSGLAGVTEAVALEESLRLAVPGAEKVTRRGYADGRAVYELQVFADALPLLARALETAPALKRFRLNVGKETRSRVTVTVTAPLTSR